jgi:hypothetical protein
MWFGLHQVFVACPGHGTVWGKILFLSYWLLGQKHQDEFSGLQIMCSQVDEHHCVVSI